MFEVKSSDYMQCESIDLLDKTIEPKRKQSFIKSPRYSRYVSPNNIKQQTDVTIL